VSKEEILKQEKANEIAIAWIIKQGFQGKTRQLSTWQKPEAWCFEFIHPYGLFKVDKKTGEVEDNYRYFSEEKANTHDPKSCKCLFCKN
jgi:hypothetical protein